MRAELHAGKQSRVFDAVRGGRRAAIKLTDARFADQAVLGARMAAVEALATDHPAVVSPVRIDGALVQPIGGWLMTATPFVVGDRLEDDDPSDAARLGAALAALHGAMRLSDPSGVPAIAALDATGFERDRVGWQLLHGDFGTHNVIVTSDGLRLVDFDDCGYGPVEYDLANSLYMVHFDAEVNNRPERYDAFRPAFLAEYTDRSAVSVAEADVDAMIDIRIDALGRWLDDLSTAPIGIRTSSPEWLDTLRSFVDSHTMRE